MRLGSLAVLYLEKGVPHVLGHGSRIGAIKRELDLVPLVHDAAHGVHHHCGARSEGLQQLESIRNTY